MRYLTILATVAIALSACTYQPDRSARLKPVEATDMLKQCSRRSAPPGEAYWQVSASTARDVEHDLHQLRMSRAWTSKLPPKAFYRQYIGITSSGRKLVYINAFSPKALGDRRALYREIPEIAPKGASDWRHKVIGACDGGEHFWGAVYDPETHRFSELEFNFSA